MASTNQSPQYQKAEANFLTAQTDKEKLYFLEEMIRECPKHKSAEKMLAQLKTRRKKLLEKIEKSKKAGKSKTGKQGIKKEEMQAVIIGFANTGKSCLLSMLTNTKPEITPYPFTTKKPLIGMMDFQGTQTQIIEIPAFNSEYFDKGLVNTADTLLILIKNFDEISEISKSLNKAQGKRIIIFNLFNKSKEELRKIKATLQSKRHDFIIVDLNKNFSSNESEKIQQKYFLNELKEKIFQSFGKIRVFTKEPGKSKTERPIILEEGQTVKDVAEKILHGFSNKVKESFVTGPSSKFPNQKVGLKHVLRDMDVVEFKIR